MLVVFCEKISEIALSFMVGMSKLTFFCVTNFEFYSYNYFGTEGVLNQSFQCKSGSAAH